MTPREVAQLCHSLGLGTSRGGDAGVAWLTAHDGSLNTAPLQQDDSVFFGSLLCAVHGALCGISTLIFGLKQLVALDFAAVFFVHRFAAKVRLGRHQKAAICCGGCWCVVA